MNGVKIAGIGIALPKRIVTNDDIVEILLVQRQKVLDSGIELTPKQMEEYVTSDEWIVVRSGIHERRFAEKSETTSDYAAKAGHGAWTDAYGDGLEIPEFLLVATVSPDHFTTPATSVITHRKMGIPVHLRDKSGKRSLRRFIARDITQACSSLMMALEDGFSLIRSGECQCGLVVGADLMTRVMSWNRRSPFVILADAGAALVLEAVPEKESWFVPNAFFAGINGGPDGEHEKLIMNRAGGAALPATIEHLDPRVDEHMMFMNGNEVFRKIVRIVANEIIPAALAHASLTLKDIDVLILHPANLRMIEAIVERLLKANSEITIRMATREDVTGKLVLAKGESAPRSGAHTIVCYTNIDHFGNTTSPSIPLSVYEAREFGIIQPGKRVMTVAYGGGFSWASAIIEWGGRNHSAFQIVD